MQQARASGTIGVLAEGIHKTSALKAASRGWKKRTLLHPAGEGAEVPPAELCLCTILLLIGIRIQGSTLGALPLCSQQPVLLPNAASSPHTSCPVPQGAEWDNVLISSSKTSHSTHLIRTCCSPNGVFTNRMASRAAQAMTWVCLHRWTVKPEVRTSLARVMILRYHKQTNK